MQVFPQVVADVVQGFGVRQGWQELDRLAERGLAEQLRSLPGLQGSSDLGFRCGCWRFELQSGEGWGFGLGRPLLQVLGGLGFRRLLAQVIDQLEQGGSGDLDASYLAQGFGIGCQDFLQGAEFGQEALGERENVALRDAIGQQQLQQCLISARGCRAVEKPLTQPLTVTSLCLAAIVHNLDASLAQTGAHYPAA